MCQIRLRHQAGSLAGGRIRQNPSGFNFLLIGGDFVKGAINGLLAVLSLVIAAVSFIFYRQNANTALIVLAIVFVVAAVAFGAMFLSGRINKTEDIHITE
jgi:hypothetical protein